MEVKKERFNNVDFIRFIFSIIIVFIHIPLLYNMNIAGIHKGRILVDYFFIMSGFFLFLNINKNEDTLSFAIKKIIRLAPVTWFLSIITMICSLFIPALKYNFNNTILGFLFFQDIGLSSKFSNPPFFGILWYIFVLFWVMIFYFYLNKLLEKKYMNLIVWLIIIISYSIYYNNNNFGIGGNSNICLFINIGVLRGLAGMGIGYFLSMLYKTNFLKSLSKKGQVITSFIEIYILLFLTEYLLFSPKIPGNSAFILIVYFCIFFYLLIIKQGIISKLTDNKISSYLGQFSYSIYVMQILVLSLYKYLLVIPHPEFIQNHILFCNSIITVTCIIFGVIAFYLVEKPAAKYLKEKFLNIQKPITNQ